MRYKRKFAKTKNMVNTGSHGLTFDFTVYESNWRPWFKEVGNIEIGSCTFVAKS